ncbi:unnamed protein product [Clavelina lepadiformis]|uniref:Uncharacterized protein n=1 Tax=Clavelina lepadiformis TaxID=159417 RepID=A0ABP0G8E3_CLALP
MTLAATKELVLLVESSENLGNEIVLLSVKGCKKLRELSVWRLSRHTPWQVRTKKSEFVELCTLVVAKDKVVVVAVNMSAIALFRTCGAFPPAMHRDPEVR